MLLGYSEFRVVIKKSSSEYMTLSKSFNAIYGISIKSFWSLFGKSSTQNPENLFLDRGVGYLKKEREPTSCQILHGGSRMPESLKIAEAIHAQVGTWTITSLFWGRDSFLFARFPWIHLTAWRSNHFFCLLCLLVCKYKCFCVNEQTNRTEKGRESHFFSFSFNYHRKEKKILRQLVAEFFANSKKLRVSK